MFRQMMLAINAAQNSVVTAEEHLAAVWTEQQQSMQQDCITARRLFRAHLQLRNSIDLHPTFQQEVTD
jgi:hypothetical protein